MDNLQVNGELTAVVVDNQDTDAAAAGVERALEAGPEVGLVNDGQILLDVARVGHGDDGAVLEVEHAVLLEDRSEHGLDDNGRRRVGHGGRLLVQLLGEEVNAEVTVLAGGSRGRDADDLARAALEHQDIAKANVVARDGDRVRGVGRIARGGSTGLADLGHPDVVMVMVVTLGMNQAVGELVQAVAEGVVVT